MLIDSNKTQHTDNGEKMLITIKAISKFELSVNITLLQLLGD